MVRPFVVAVAFLSFTLSSLAQLTGQVSGSPAHNHAEAAPTQLIDGSVNPEKIPDSTAYRLWFLMAGVNPNVVKPEDQAKEHARHEGQIKKLSLSDQDSKQVAAILNDFRVQYAALIKSYNDNNAILRSQRQNPDQGAFIDMRDKLVQATRDKLAATVSFDGISRLDTHVQNEKSQMKSNAPPVTVATATRSLP